MLASGAAAGEPPDAEEAAPSAELLMYLGEFEDAGGEFVDPLALEEAAQPESARAARSEDEKGKRDDAEQSDE